jgi:hypothetical protein
MIRKFVGLRWFGLVGLWFLLGACEGTNADGGVGGTAGTGHPADAGGQGSSAGAGDAGASAGDGAASAMNVGRGGSDDEPSHGHGHGGNRAQNPGMGRAGASGEASAGGDAGSGGAAPVDEFMIPCDVYAATGVCRNCHRDPATHDAPMALLTLEDLQTYADRASRAIQTGVMPAAGELSEQEAALIVAWLEAGAHGVPTETCP